MKTALRISLFIVLLVTNSCWGMKKTQISGKLFKGNTQNLTKLSNSTKGMDKKYFSTSFLGKSKTGNLFSRNPLMQSQRSISTIKENYDDGSTANVIVPDNVEEFGLFIDEMVSGLGQEFSKITEESITSLDGQLKAKNITSLKQFLGAIEKEYKEMVQAGYDHVKKVDSKNISLLESSYQKGLQEVLSTAKKMYLSYKSQLPTQREKPSGSPFQSGDKKSYSTGFFRGYSENVKQENQRNQENNNESTPWYKRWWAKIFGSKVALGAGLIVGTGLTIDQIVDRFKCKEGNNCISAIEDIFKRTNVYIYPNIDSATIDGTNKKIYAIYFGGYKKYGKIDNITISNFSDEINIHLTYDLAGRNYIRNACFSNITKGNIEYGQSMYSGLFTIWEKCLFENVNLRFKCNFGQLQDCTIKDSTLAKDYDLEMRCKNCTLSNITFDGTNPFFDRSEFKIVNSTFENSVLENLQCIKGSSLTFEDVTFTNIDFKNSGLLNNENVVFRYCTFTNCEGSEHLNNRLSCLYYP